MDDSRYLRTGSLALGMGVLLSPDNLVLLGNFMGNTGWPGLGLLAAAAVLFTGLALNPAPRAGKKEHMPFAFVPLVVRGAACLLLSTGILVSSGFAFNEIFLYWFPNFGFAFLLLAIVLVIQLAGTGSALKAQILFTGLTLAFLCILILSGPGRASAPTPPLPVPAMGILSLPLMFWVGFDLATAGPGKKKSGALAVIAAAGALFILWGMVSITLLPLEKLSASSLPHIKTAGALLGQTGRYLMGAAVITGTLAAVNGLFLGCRYAAGQLAGRSLLPPWTGNRFVIPTVLAAAIGIMMAWGTAGSDSLELWIRAAFLAWLLTYVRPEKSVIPLCLTIILTAGTAGILFSGHRPGPTAGYTATILGTGIIPGLVLNLILPKKRSLS